MLLGPRQTGKSTLIQTLAPELEVNLARESEYLSFSANPSELEQRIALGKPATVFIDEVQRLPSVLNTVQALIDDAKRQNRRLRFLLTGSSARKLRRGHANLLPGRILTFALGPLTAGELGDAFDVRRAMEIGTLPEPYLEQDRDAAEKLLETYAGTYLKEEIQAEALSRNLQGFSRFLKVAATASGQLLDFSKIAQRAQVSRTSTVRYFELLEDTLLVHRLTPFPDATHADLVKHPKFYFFDPGVLNGLLGSFNASADRIGSLFEHVVASQLHATAMALDKRADFHTFRTRGGLEIDFVTRIGGATWAIEAKATSHPSEADASSLLNARAYLPAATRLVLVIPSGAPRRLGKAVDVLPLANLLAQMMS